MDLEEVPTKKARTELRGVQQLRRIRNRRNVDEGTVPGLLPSTSGSGGNWNEVMAGPSSVREHRHCCIDTFLRRTESVRDNLDDEIFEGNEAELETDQFMERWQDHRITLAYVDNVINVVLERYRSPDFEQANSEGIEEDAISHAIEAHGLQQQPQQRPFPSGLENADFMQEAVDCAIYEKGLSVYGSAN